MKALILLALVSLLAACNTPGRSKTTDVHATGILWQGRTIGPVQRLDGRMTIIDCVSADQYQAMKKGGVIEAAVWKSQGCTPLLVKASGAADFLTPDDAAALLKMVKKIAWSNCLQNQYWFCDGTKVDAEIDAAFSMTASQGQWISGTDWVDGISKHITLGYAQLH